MIYILAATLIATLLTALERFTPFILFSQGNPPAFIRYLGHVLPPAMIAILVIFCYKGVDFSTVSAYAPQLIAGTITALLHIWKKSTILSIVGGTILYMILIRTIFIPAA